MTSHCRRPSLSLALRICPALTWVWLFISSPVLLVRAEKPRCQGRQRADTVENMGLFAQVLPALNQLGLHGVLQRFVQLRQFAAEKLNSLRGGGPDQPALQVLQSLLAFAELQPNALPQTDFQLVELLRLVA